MKADQKKSDILWTCTFKNEILNLIVHNFSVNSSHIHAILFFSPRRTPDSSEDFGRNRQPVLNDDKHWWTGREGQTCEWTSCHLLTCLCWTSRNLSISMIINSSSHLSKAVVSSRKFNRFIHTIYLKGRSLLFIGNKIKCLEFQNWAKLKV